MLNALVKFLERLGIRCRECRSWNKSDISITRQMEWGTDVGGMLSMDLIHITTERRVCECGHLMSSRTVRIEDAEAILECQRDSLTSH